MGAYKYKFTVFTPCYNSSRFIHRIFETLNSQTYRDFEWIVINDASTDNTAELITEYIKTVDFPVKFFNLEKNQMLAANYNLAFNNCEGEIFVVTGHDDIYMPDMLEEYVRLYNKYNGPDICGLVGRCITQYGKITPKEFTKPLLNYWEYGVDKKGKNAGEAPRALKTEIMKRYMPFDPEDKLNPLIEGMMGCDGYKFITTNKIVRTYYVNENETCLSQISGKFPQYYWRQALLNINKFQYFKHTSFFDKVQCCAFYACYSIRCNFTFSEAINALEHDRFMTILLYPLGYLLVFISKNPFLKNILYLFLYGKKRPQVIKK